MRRLARQDSTQRDMGGSATPAHIPAPVKGWNTRDPVAAMDPLYALVLENLFPTQGEVQLRSGYSIFAESASGTVKSLATYQSPTGTSYLFACTDAGIYDITHDSQVGQVAPLVTTATLVAALTEGNWDWINFTNSVGTTFLWGCNGVDSPWIFDGTTWTQLTDVSTPALCNVTSADLVAPWVFKRRIFTIEKNTMTAWYLPVDSISGNAHKLPIGGLFKLGGYLVAGTSWTIDGGDGSDDFCVFLTSEGEAAVYRGTNPDSANSWGLVGVYYIGRPANRRCFQRFGGDVAVLTEIGCLPLSKALTSSNFNTAAALSDSIRSSITYQMKTNRSLANWQIYLYASKNALILNIPQGNGSFTQYVMNTITGAWCSFVSWNSYCYVSYKGTLFFGLANGKVAQAWVDGTAGDNTVDISGRAQTAFTVYGAAGRVKKLLQIRPLLTLDDTVTVGWGFTSDYRAGSITSTLDTTIGGPTNWDVALWDVSYWTAEPYRFTGWLTASSREGYAYSILLKITTQDATVSWSGTDHLLTAGGLI